MALFRAWRRKRTKGPDRGASPAGRSGNRPRNDLRIHQIERLEQLLLMATGPLLTMDLAPEIAVLDGNADLVDGLSRIALGTTAVGAPLTRTFTVRNLGDADLTLGTPSLPAGFSLASGLGATTLAPDASTSFAVRFDAVAEGEASGPISLATNDPDEDPFDFTIAASAVLVVDDGEAGFSTAGAWTSFAGQGFRDDVHFTAAGTGTDSATWAFADLTPGRYRVSATWSPFSNRASNAPFTVLDGTTALATVRLDQRSAPDDFADLGAAWEDLGGIYDVTGSTLTVRLSDAADGAVIADAVRVERLGDLAEGPEVEVLDGASRLADNTGSVAFGSTALGNPLTRTFTVRNVGLSDLHLGTITLPAGFSLASGFGATALAPGASTAFSVRFDADAAGLAAGRVSFGTDDPDEDPFDFAVNANAVAPEVAVLDGAVDLADGLASVAFGTTVAGAPLTHTFTVRNLGTADLHLGALTLPDGFSLAAGLGAATLAPGASTSFAVRFDAATPGLDALGTVLLATDDADEDPFDFTIAASTASAAVRVVDDGEAGFSTAGAWTSFAGQGFRDDVHFTAAGTGTDSATWAFADLTPGRYRVSATWSPFSNRASNAPFTVLDGTTALATVRLDQRSAPDDFADLGAAWEDLGGIYDVTGSTLTVRLSDAADGAVIADAVRVERLGDLPAGPEIQVLVFGADLPDNTGSVAFGTALAGTPVPRTFTVRNVGLSDLHLGTITLPAGFSLASGFGATALAPGASTAFSVQFDAAALGTFSGRVSFGTDDPDEDPFDFAVNANAVAPEVAVLDGAVDLADGLASVAFGTTVAGAPLTHTFTVRNLGTADLHLGALTLPDGFSLAAGLGAATLAPGASTSFAVRFDAATPGLDALGTVLLATDDADEDPFDFTIAASTASAAVRVVDDGEAGFSTAGAWTSFAGQGFRDDVTYALAGAGAANATWAFAGLAPGRYRVSATWVPFTDRASNAPFTVLDGTTALATVRLDQRSAPDDFADLGAAWEDLGGIYDVTGSTLTVRLSDAADGLVIADAVRVERLGDLAAAPEIQVFDGGADLADGTGSVAFGSTALGNPLTRTFAVRNAGTADLHLGAFVLPAGFSLASGFGSTRLASGEVTSFTIRFDATPAGSYGDRISFITDDPDEDPFDFAVTATAVAPEVQVLDGTADLADGTGSVAFGPTLIGVSLTRTFTVRNAGTADLHLGAIVVPDGFSLATGLGATTLAPGASTAFAVRFDASTLGNVVGRISLVTDDADEDPFDFEVSAAATTPEIEVLDGATDLTDGVGSVGFGTTPVGTPLTRTFTVRNAGTADLHLGAIAVPAGFRVSSGPVATTLAPGASTTFSVQLIAAATGTFGGSVHLASDDLDENPFDFNVSATAVLVLDDGEPGFSTVGAWTTFGDQGYRSDVRYIAAGTGNSTATWAFTGLAPGRYRVSATWVPFSNRATDAPYTILDGTNSLATVRVDQRQSPDDFSDLGAAWEDLGGTFDVTGSTLTVRLSDAANGVVIADAIRVERLGDPPIGPEVAVLDGTTDLADGVSSIALGGTLVGTPLTRTFTVRNVGTADLHLGTPSLPAGFSLASGLGAATLAPGASTSFTVRFDAPAAGAFGGTLSFATDDADEDPFDFAINANAVLILDDGEAAFNTAGAWTHVNDQGFRSDVTYAAAGSGAATATWAFAGLAPGRYRVSATWSPFADRATNAPFTILEGASVLTTATVDQRQAPAGFGDQGATWKDLATVTIAGSTLTVRLSNQADGVVIADAIRLERLDAPPIGPEVAVLDGTTDLVDGSGSVALGTTLVGTPLTRTFTVRNVGTADLHLGTPSLPAGFSLASGLGAATLAPGASTSFTVRFDAPAAGAFGGTLSFATDDADEDPFDFAINANADPLPSVLIVDDGEAGFSTTGAWTRFNDQGFRSDVTFSAAGTGTATATWAFAGLTPGTYRISSTWSSFSNRATNAPFTVLDGNTTVATVPIDQRQAPDDFADQGAFWEDLGTFQVTGSTLTVRLSDAADGAVIADAIRVVRLGDLQTGPEIEVLDGVAGLTDGLGSIALGTTAVGTPLTRTFTVRNVGTADLHLGALSLPTGFSLAAGLDATTLAPGASTTFAVRFDATAVGTIGGTVRLANDDGDEDPFDLNVNANAVLVLDDGEAGFSTSGAWTPFAGQGFRSDVTYAAAGSGASTATWAFAGLAPGRYRVSATWSPFSNRATNAPYTVLDGTTVLTTASVNQQVAPNSRSDLGASWKDLGTFLFSGGTLTVRLSNQANGVVIADAIRVDRLDDLPAGPEIQVLDGTTDLADGASGIALGSTLVGTPLTRTFTVRNVGLSDLHLGTITLPAGFSLATGPGATTLAFGASTSFTVRFDAAAAGSFGGTLSFVNDDADENPFDIAVTANASAPAPEVQVLDGAADLADGVGSVAFGTTPVGTPLTRTFTVRNLGTADLTLGSITLPAGFSLASGLGVTALAPGASTAFAVRFDAAAAGTAGGRVSFATNDADEDPFDFAINANAAAPPTVLVLDDGEAGFSTSGAWTPFAGQGFRSDVTYAAAGSGASTATWAFAGLAPGQYRVSATWSPFSNRATDAPYTVLDGATVLTTASVNQQVAPAGLGDQGATWKDLGTVTLVGTTLTVRLSNAANGVVIADAIRIERIGEATPAPEIAVLDGAADLADGVGSVAFGTTPVGTPLTRTFTVRNLGTADLTLGSITLPAGFSLASGLGVTALAPGASTAFAVRFDAAAAGTAGGRVSFATNDADEDPFDFAINANAVVPGPEIQVLDGTADLADGVGSVAFGTTPVGTPLTRTFTVRNLGTADLTLGTPSLPAGFSLASGLGVTALAPGASTAFAVRFDAAAAGTAGGRVSFATNDADEDPFDFAINANAADAPTVLIIDDGEPGFSTSSGAWKPSFDGQGFRSDVRYVAAGTGADTATWAFTGLAPGRYRVSATWSPFSNRASNAPFTILDGATVLTTVAVDQRPAPVGFADQGATWQDLATVTIAGPNLTVRLTNAANGYVIADAIRIERIGEATPAPEIAVLDGAADLADGVGSVAFGTTPVGTPLTRTFTVRNLGTADLTLGSITLPAGFSLASGLGVTALAPGASTAFAVRFDAAAAGTAGGRVSFATNDADEDPFDFAINANAVVPGPEIQVLDGAADLADGVGSVAFGTTPVGTPLTRTFTVRNLGTADLTLGSITLPAGFSLASGLGVTALAPGASTAFAVRFDAAAAGTAGGRVSFATNDADEDPFDFAINANAAAPPTVLVLDDGEAGFSTSGAWTPFAGQGFRSDVTYAAAGSGASTATWAFAGLAPGQYRVSATWSPFSNRATNAPYTVLDGATVLTTASVNQQVAPAGLGDQGATWKDLGTVTLVGTTLTVRLSNAANGVVIADAIRIERIGEATPAPEIAVLDGAADLADGVGSVAFGTTPVGTPLTRTFTVRNLGTADLTLGSITLPAGFSLASGLGVTALAPGASTAFAVRFDAAAAGTAGGRVSFATNDADEDPFDFAINANAVVPGPEIQVLDGTADLADGVGSVAFGTTPVGTPLTRTFTVRNLGTADLTLGTPSLPAGFSLASGLGVTTLAPGASTAFAVRFDAAAAGTAGGRVSFATNDADEDPFDFAINANAADAPTVLIIDDGEPGFSTSSGAWKPSFDGQGFRSDVRYVAAGTGADTATWAFTGLAPGRYRVSATWSPFSNRASNAPFTILDGATVLTTVAVDQRPAPVGFADQGATWQDLATVTIAGPNLTVRLTNAANNYVIADAIRIERIG